MASSSSSQIRSTKTYLWYLSDVLGTGATSTVYRGRHKKTGDLVAAKAFNNISYMRPQSVQQREMDVLLKLSHPNIVKLFDIEQDQITKNPVIIMELCAGGSLHTVLDDPRNAFGLEEEEFKRALEDVCAGMKHLRDLDIVHRDIKPGNIMVVTAGDGKNVYKLADFGAARELQDDENFMSLYGTEEYLHPDLYERAVLRQPSHKAFTARIDLWSIGVTFYHLATGSLPFRPYGGRKNRETMYQITTQKTSGVISGVQRESMRGPIEWSSELPDTSRLSSGLRHQLTKILQGLLESNPEHMWTFNRFFDAVQHLLSLKVMDVFHVGKSECLRVYVEPQGTLAEFQEAVAELTGLQAPSQALVWEQDCFVPDLSQRCASYPSTSSQKPILLLEKGREDFPPAPTPVQPKLPKMTSSYDLDRDAMLSKTCVAVLYSTLAWLQRITCMQELMTCVVKSIVHVLKAELQQLDYHSNKLRAHSVEVATRLCTIQQMLPSPLVSSAVFQRLLIPPRSAKGYSMPRRKLKASSMADTFGLAERRLRNLSKLLVEEDVLTKQWVPAHHEELQPCYQCLRRFEFFTEEARKIYSQFRKDKQRKQLTYNEEQIHKMDKEKLNIKCGEAVSLCQSHCENRWKAIHRRLSEWYLIAHRYQDQISQIDTSLSRLVREYQTLLQDVHLLEVNLQPVVNEFEETLVYSLSLNVSHPARLPPMKIDVATNTEEARPSNVNSGVNLLGEVEPLDTSGFSASEIASVSEQLGHLPMDEKGHVLVPRAVKNMFEAWEKDIDTVTRQMEEGREQLELMQNLSLSFPPEDSSKFHTLSPEPGKPTPVASLEGASFLTTRNPPSYDSLLHTSHLLSPGYDIKQFIVTPPEDDDALYAYDDLGLARTKSPTVNGGPRPDSQNRNGADVPRYTVRTNAARHKSKGKEEEEMYAYDDLGLSRTKSPTVNGGPRKYREMDLTQYYVDTNAVRPKSKESDISGGK